MYISLFWIFYIFMSLYTQCQGKDNAAGTIYSFETNNDIKENFLDERGRRGFAVVELWKDALTLLFKGARKLGIDKGGYQVFEKKGLYNNALGDFIAAKPRGVRTQLTEDREKITGLIGDQKLQLISQRSDRGTKYNPTLQIIDIKTERPLYKFVYKLDLQ